jgi:hypothetical protein
MLLAVQVQEYFGDFIALEAHHFMVPLPRPHLALQPFAWDFANSSDAVARMTEGVASLMLSLRRRFLIRWGGEGGGAGVKAGVLSAQPRSMSEHRCPRHSGTSGGGRCLTRRACSLRKTGRSRLSQNKKEPPRGIERALR